MSNEEIASLRRELAESKVLLEQHTKTISDLTYEKDNMESKKNDLEGRLNTLEHEYEELLDKTIAEEEAEAKSRADIADTITDIKSKLEATHAAKKEIQQKEIEDLKKELERKNQDHQKLSSAMTDLKAANEQLQVRINGIRIVYLMLMMPFFSFFIRLHWPIKLHLHLPLMVTLARKKRILSACVNRWLNSLPTLKS